ncbi:MAG: DUF5301 domain-containing protein [Proteocatella sp.]
MISVGLIIILISGIRLNSIEIPRTQEIQSISITNYEINTEKNTIEITDTKKIDEITNWIKIAKKTNKESLSDFPNVQNFIKLEFNLENGASRLFIYKDEKYYVEQPYIGIFEISDNHNIFNIN